MLEQMEAKGFITDPVKKCLRTEVMVEENRLKSTPINVCLGRSDTWIAAEKGMRLDKLFSSKGALQRYLIWLCGPRGDSEKDESVADQVESSGKSWLHTRPGYSFSAPHLVWVDPKNGMVRQDLASGGFAYAFLQDVYYSLFQKKDHLFVRGRSG
jgi:hypothetical protein